MCLTAPHNKDFVWMCFTCHTGKKPPRDTKLSNNESQLVDVNIGACNLATRVNQIRSQINRMNERSGHLGDSERCLIYGRMFTGSRHEPCDAGNRLFHNQNCSAGMVYIILQADGFSHSQIMPRRGHLNASLHSHKQADIYTWGGRRLNGPFVLVLLVQRRNYGTLVLLKMPQML